MCLFTTDIYSQCKHVQCNLIRAIQLQNTAIFPQVHSLNNDSQSQMINEYHNNPRESESIQPNNSQINQRVIQEKQINSNQFLVKQQSPQNHLIAQNLQPINYQFNGTMVNEKGSNPPLSTQGIMFYGHSQTKTAENRIQNLQMQVGLLKDGMEALVMSLKDKNIINQREYQDQMTFLQQFESHK